MANYMNQIAELLGVELGESFKIVDDNGDKSYNYYRLTDKKGIESSKDDVNWEETIAGTRMLRYLLIGEARIIKLPWKPQDNERYYTPFIATNPRNMYDEYYWENDDVDIERYRMGLVCKTSVEAVELTQKMLAVVQEQAVE